MPPASAKPSVPATAQIPCEERMPRKTCALPHWCCWPSPSLSNRRSVMPLSRRPPRPARSRPRSVRLRPVASRRRCRSIGCRPSATPPPPSCSIPRSSSSEPNSRSGCRRGLRLRRKASLPRRLGASTPSHQDLGARPERFDTETFTVLSDEAQDQAQLQADLTDLSAPAAERSAHATARSRWGRPPEQLPPGRRTRAVRTDHLSPSARPQPPPQRRARSAPPASSPTRRTTATGTPAAASPSASSVARTAAAETTTLASGLTAATDGTYRLCFKHSGPALAMMWAQFSTRTSWWEVTEMTGPAPYVVDVAPLTNVAVGTTQTFGTPVPTRFTRRTTPSTRSTACTRSGDDDQLLDPRGAPACSRLKLALGPGNTDGGYYNTDPASGRSSSPTPCPTPAPVCTRPATTSSTCSTTGAGCPSTARRRTTCNKVTGPMCAWTEGFANAVTGYAMGDGRYYFNVPSVDGPDADAVPGHQPAVGRTNPDNGEAAEAGSPGP